MNTHEWKEYEDFEKLLTEKSYSELTMHELRLVSQFVSSQQEYENMRLSGLEMKKWFRDNPITNKGDESLLKLKQAFRQQQPAVNYSLPKVWIGYAMVALLFGFGGWWLGKSEPAVPLTRVEKILMHDTVYLTSKPDTIFRERIIYKDRPIVLSTGNRQPEAPNTKGVSMKEKEELDKLLVSGSD
ncbi:MAG TPA: hypothetical protein PKK67_04945 [Cyclobacteriaceae bacterium]|nr:MAG: hypothetical protein UZ12_BCD005002263 [Bacteroidetes bacterium OLB12]HNR74452.1 hypothetical protein [Cyclobacteriaceae bacterium]HNT49911.1 hypothetical protein [Cyclobacteriaceae bacterium]